MAKLFLSARWENLIMANYEVDPVILEPHLPRGVELDYWRDKALVSLVGFMFLDTKVMGVGIPFHRDFEEVNLRFYVRRQEGGEWRRGVVFISEIVPRGAIAWVARTLYGEPYRRLSMRHSLVRSPEALQYSYEWRLQGHWNRLGVIADPQPEPIREGSEEEFIFEHYWGYTTRPGNRTDTYQVEHPRWNVFPVREHEISCDFATMYGPTWQPFLEQDPQSVFLAEGSEITVRQGQKVSFSAT